MNRTSSGVMTIWRTVCPHSLAAFIVRSICALVIACFFKLSASDLGDESDGRIDSCCRIHAWRSFLFPRVSLSPCCYSSFRILSNFKDSSIEQFRNTVDLRMKAARDQNHTQNASKHRLDCGNGRCVPLFLRLHQRDGGVRHSALCHAGLHE